MVVQLKFSAETQSESGVEGSSRGRARWIVKNTGWCSCVRKRESLAL